MTPQSQSTPKLRTPRWPAGLAPWRQTVESFLERLAKAVGTQIEIIGATRSSGDGNTLTFNVPGSGLAASSGGLDVSAAGTVVPSTILGVVPTIGGDEIYGTYTPLTIGSGTKHVIATVTSTVVSTTLSGQVFHHPALTGITVALSVTTTLPDGDDLISTSGSFIILLATFVDGVKTLQNGHGPLTGYVQDQLDGSGAGLLVLTWASL